MALVSYDSSDCSDLEDQERTDKGAEILQTVTPTECTTNEIPRSLFLGLPKPTQKIVREEDDEFLHKREAVKKEKAKITIPSLYDFKDVDLLTKKVFQHSEKKCGLLSMLPEPKFTSSSVAKSTKSDEVKQKINNTSLIPDTVQQKINITSSSKCFIPDAVRQKMMNPNPCPTVTETTAQKNTGETKQASSVLGADYSDSDEGDSETRTDFFSFNLKEEITSACSEVPGLAATLSDNLNEKSPDYAESNGHTYNNTQIYYNSAPCDSMSQEDYTGQSASSSGSIELDDEAIRQLCGSRKRKRKEVIKVINVDQNQVLSNAHELLMKNLMDDTAPRVSASKLKGNGPTGQEKRKHQITYLAHQAKVNEAELQNQWAQNRMTKRQTQSKYGF